MADSNWWENDAPAATALPAASPSVAGGDSDWWKADATAANPSAEEQQRQYVASLNDPTAELPATAAALVAKAPAYYNDSAIGRDVDAGYNAIFGTPTNGQDGGALSNLWQNARNGIGNVANSIYTGTGNIKDQIADAYDTSPDDYTFAAKALGATGLGLGEGIYNLASPFVRGGIKLATDYGGDLRRSFGDTSGAAQDEAQVDLDTLKINRAIDSAKMAAGNYTGIPALATGVANVAPFALPGLGVIELGPDAAAAGNLVTRALTPASSTVAVSPAVATSSGSGIADAVSAASHFIPHGRIIRGGIKLAQSLGTDDAPAEASFLKAPGGPSLPVAYQGAAQSAASDAAIANNLSTGISDPNILASATGQITTGAINAGVGIGTGGAFGLASSDPGEEEDSIRGGLAQGALLSPASVIGGAFQRQGLAEAAKNADLVKAGASRSTGTDLVSPEKATVINGLQGTFAGAKTPDGNPIRYVVQSPEDYAVSATKAASANPSEAGQLQDAADSRGFFNYDTGKIHLNAADPDLLGTLHETGHAVASALSGIDTGQAEFLNGSIINSALQNGQPTPGFQRFIDQYNGGKPVDWDSISPQDKLYYQQELGAQTAAMLGNLTNPAKYALPPELSDTVFNALGDYARKLGVVSSPNILSGIGDPAAQPVPADVATIQASRAALRTIASQPRSGINLVPDATPARDGIGYQMPMAEPKTGIPVRSPSAIIRANTPLVSPTLADGSVAPGPPEPLPVATYRQTSAYKDALAVATLSRNNLGLGLKPKDAQTILDRAAQDPSVPDNVTSYVGYVQKALTPTPANPAPVASNIALQGAVSIEPQGGIASPAAEPIAPRVVVPAVTSGAEPPAIPPATPIAPEPEPVNRFTDTRPAPATDPRDVAEISNPLAGPLVQPTLEASGGANTRIPVPAAMPVQEAAQTPVSAPSNQTPFTQADIDRIRAQVENEFTPKPYKPNKGTPEEKAQKVADNAAMQLRTAKLNAVADAHAAALPSGDSRVQMRIDPETGGRSIRGTHFVDDDPFHQQLLAQTDAGERGNISNIQKAISDGDLLNFDYNSADRVRTQQTAAQRQESQAQNTVAMRRNGLGIEEANKSFRPYSLSIGQDGTVNVNGYSPDKLLGNAETVLEAMRANDMSDRLPYENVNDPLFVSDVQSYIRNHANGYKGDGSARLTPTDDVSVPQPEPGYVPTRLPPARANLMNIILGAEPTLSEKQIVASTGLQTASAKARAFAAANDNVPAASGEVNPLRGELNAANLPKVGDDVGSKATLHPDVLSETLKPEFMSNFRDPGTSPEFTNLRAAPFRGDRRALLPEGRSANRQFASAGFLPQSSF